MAYVLELDLQLFQLYGLKTVRLPGFLSVKVGRGDTEEEQF